MKATISVYDADTANPQVLAATLAGCAAEAPVAANIDIYCSRRDADHEGRYLAIVTRRPRDSWTAQMRASFAATHPA